MVLWPTLVPYKQVHNVTCASCLRRISYCLTSVLNPGVGSVSSFGPRRKNSPPTTVVLAFSLTV